MGEERADSQRLKRAAAAAYDYENDPRWADYWSNVLIPPHMSSRPDVVDHYKRKFYQRYIVGSLPFDCSSFGYRYFFNLHSVLWIHLTKLLSFSWIIRRWVANFLLLSNLCHLILANISVVECCLL